MAPNELDQILGIQLAVAWAGEGQTDPPRLGWWRTAMREEYAGQDLLRRLTPRTWEWAALETARAAAKKVDEAARRAADDPDHLVTLFRLGFELDERLDDRLRELKQSGRTPAEAIPALAEATSAWSRDLFEAWLRRHGDAQATTTATGRRLRGEPPAEPTELVTKLAAALLPLAPTYPLPHYRTLR